ncbi:MAG: hypothetical protein HY074_15655 [Deltaproteobacteria bacterium]|nr:hypothetical protein [Deltaproteobacteria bacterium]
MVSTCYARLATTVVILGLALSTLCFGAEKKAHYYLLSKPITSDVQLGKVARVVHPLIVGAMAFGYTAALYGRTQEPLAILSFVGYEAVKFPAMVLRNTFADLKVRQAYARWKLLKQIASIPGISRFSMLTSGYVERDGMFLARQRNTGYIFLESEEPLDTTGDWVEKFGAPIEVPDLADTRLSLRLKFGEIEHEVTWETTLKDILEKKVMPDDVAAAWARHLATLAEDRSWRERISKKYEEDLEVVTRITLPDGTTKEIGTLLQGKSVRKLLGLTLSRRVWNFLKASFMKAPVGVDPQPLPLCERILR